MAAIRHALSREVFEPNDERLIKSVHVTKANKKKKSSFLCAVVSKEKPISAIVYQIKITKIDKDVYKKRRFWNLKDLKLVDGKDVDGAEFDLSFDRVYKWTASSVQDKIAFIVCLWKDAEMLSEIDNSATSDTSARSQKRQNQNKYLSSRLMSKYLPRCKPVFSNLSNDLFEDTIMLSEADTAMKAIGEDPNIEPEEYQAVSEREEADLEKLMSQCDFAVSNAEAFTEQLSRDLSILDGANIHTIMASEDQVQHLMEMIEDAEMEATKIENTLDSYDSTLKNVRETMEKIEEKNLLIQVQNTNSLKLCDVLEKLISQLDLGHTDQMTLLDGDLTNPVKVVECTKAALALHEAMTTSLHPYLYNMAAVQEQQKLFEKLCAKFTQRLMRHLNNLFIFLGNEQGENLSFHASELTLSNHHARHHDLAPYTDLLLWLKNTSPEKYDHLTKVYTDSLSKLYERQLRDFFESAKQMLVIKTEKDRRGKGGGSSQDLTVKGTGKPKSLSLLGVDRELFGSELDMSERQKFDKLLERMLSELEPVCLDEQQFCIRFFHLSTESGYQGTTPSQQTQVTVAASPGNLVRSASEEMLLTSQKKEKQINEELRKMMGRLFAVLESELLSFSSYYDKTDSFYSMYLLVRLNQHVMSAQDTGSFVSRTFGTVLVQAKRNFDTFMNAQEKSIEETKVSKKSRCGILPFVMNFEDFAQQACTIFQGSDRKNDLDRRFQKIVDAMFEAIPRIALEQTKTPRQVVMMENFHHLHALLSQLKISCLDSSRKEAKQKYIEHLQAYVTEFFGRPLEKLNTFFEGVHAKVLQGVKEEEIGYQLAFSKLELRKVIKEYPGKEVKKGLESLYRKVDKHLCEEENLLQVVWHSMQEEFICQYKYIQGLIERCYPGSMITLEFSIEDILQFFSDIARSH